MPNYGNLRQERGIGKKTIDHMRVPVLVSANPHSVHPAPIRACNPDPRIQPNFGRQPDVVN